MNIEKLKPLHTVKIADEKPDKTENGQTKYEINQNESIFKIRKVTEEDNLKIKLKISFSGEQSENTPRRISQRKKIQSTYYSTSFEDLNPTRTKSEPKKSNKIKSNSIEKSNIYKNEDKIKQQTPKKKHIDISTKNETKIIIPRHTIYKTEEIANNITYNFDKVSDSTADSPQSHNDVVAEAPRRLFYDVNSDTPEYIKTFYDRYNKKYDEETKKNFLESFKEETIEKSDNRISLPKFPINFTLEKTCPTSHNDFKNELEIITNGNQKEKIKVSFQPGKVVPVTEIPNPFDKEAREEYFKQFNFTMDYRSGYAPIAIQAQQEQEFNYKQHFIKKKQSCANTRLKRVCGVSYVKKLESEQLNVSHIFQKLPPLVFQGSSGCTKLEEKKDFITQIFSNITENCQESPLIVTCLEAEDEHLMREYLYYPERRLRLCRGKVWIVSSLDSLWEFVKDRSLILIHLNYDNQQLLKKPELRDFSKDEIIRVLHQSNVQMGLLCRKSISGKKSFVKTFFEGEITDDEEETEEENKNGESLIDKMKKKKVPKIKKEKSNDQAEVDENGNKILKKRGRKKKENKDTTKSDDLKGLNKKQIHFFDKAKSQLEKNSTFQDGIVGQLFNDFQGIMEPYLKMLFLNNAPFPELKQIGISQSKEGFDNTQLEMLQLELENESLTQDVKNELKLEEEIREIAEVVDTQSHELDVLKSETQPVEILQETHSSQGEPKIESLHDDDIKEDRLSCDQKVEESNQELNDDKCNLPESLAILRKDLKRDPKGNIQTLSIRAELYTHEISWKSADTHTKNLLYTFSEYLNEALIERLRIWTNYRLDIFRTNNYYELNKINQNINLVEFDTAYDENQLMESHPLNEENTNWKFSTEINTINDQQISNRILPKMRHHSLGELQDNKDSMKDLLPFSLPLYLITTRDSFAFDLIEKITYLDMNGRKVKKTGKTHQVISKDLEFFFDPIAHPSNFKSFMDKFPDFRVGVTTYHNFFSHEELSEIEAKCYETERNFFASNRMNNLIYILDHFLPMTGQMTCTSERVRRTKFFFGARYIWTRQQLSEPHSMVGAGIRVDVSEPPKWIKGLVEKNLVQAGIIEKDFINSIALNVYHDGKEGLAQHFDDAVRFRQPIFTVRLFSDSRLSFGSQFYGFCNGAFCIPMPRGCITVLEEESYAANGIKHCVRPCDMAGKSAALILRQMHHRVFSEAKLYDEFVDFPSWFSTLSIKENTVSYSDQQRLEAEAILKANSKKLDEKLPFHGGD